MTMHGNLPDDVELVRTTPVFDETTIPPGLLAAHQVAAGVWGRLVVHAGAVTFMFEDQPNSVYVLDEGDSIVIGPQRPHRVVINGTVRLAIEFHRTVKFEARCQRQPIGKDS